MSLKAFHLVFISASIALSLFVGLWGIREYNGSGSSTALLMAIFFFVLGAALVAYGIRAVAKFREIL